MYKTLNFIIFARIERENEVPVGQWLNELRFRCESECMTTLQSKSIVTSDEYCRLSTMVYTNPDLVRELYQRTKAISDEFKKVYKYVLLTFVLCMSCTKNYSLYIY